MAAIIREGDMGDMGAGKKCTGKNCPKKGKHMMPNGHMMSDSKMKKMMKKEY